MKYLLKKRTILLALILLVSVNALAEPPVQDRKEDIKPHFEFMKNILSSWESDGYPGIRKHIVGGGKDYIPERKWLWNDFFHHSQNQYFKNIDTINQNISRMKENGIYSEIAVYAIQNVPNFDRWITNKGTKKEIENRMNRVSKSVDEKMLSDDPSFAEEKRMYNKELIKDVNFKRIATIFLLRNDVLQMVAEIGDDIIVGKEEIPRRVYPSPVVKIENLDFPRDATEVSDRELVKYLMLKDSFIAIHEGSAVSSGVDKIAPIQICPEILVGITCLYGGLDSDSITKAYETKEEPGPKSRFLKSKVKYKYAEIIKPGWILMSK